MKDKCQQYKFRLIFHWWKRVFGAYCGPCRQTQNSQILFAPDHEWKTTEGSSRSRIFGISIDGAAGNNCSTGLDYCRCVFHRCHYGPENRTHVLSSTFLNRSLMSYSFIFILFFQSVLFIIIISWYHSPNFIFMVDLLIFSFYFFVVIYHNGQTKESHST